MYHPQTTDTPKARRARTIGLLAFVVAIAVAAAVFFAAQNAVREQGAISMRTSILNAAKQCASIEGAYPQSIAYLEDHYGLVVNSADYLITYESYADNVVPSVVVVPR